MFSLRRKKVRVCVWIFNKVPMSDVRRRSPILNVRVCVISRSIPEDRSVGGRR